MRVYSIQIRENVYSLSCYALFTGSTNTAPPNWLESRAPTIFLVAGVWFVGYTGIKVTRLVTDITVPDVVGVSVGSLGLLILTFGLLGFYPQVRSGAPRLARAGVALTVLSGVCSTAILVVLIDLMFAVEGLPAIPEAKAFFPIPGSRAAVRNALLITGGGSSCLVSSASGLARSRYGLPLFCWYRASRGPRSS